MAVKFIPKLLETEIKPMEQIKCFVFYQYECTIRATLKLLYFSIYFAQISD